MSWLIGISGLVVVLIALTVRSKRRFDVGQEAARVEGGRPHGDREVSTFELLREAGFDCILHRRSCTYCLRPALRMVWGEVRMMPPGGAPIVRRVEAGKACLYCGYILGFVRDGLLVHELDSAPVPIMEFLSAEAPKLTRGVYEREMDWIGRQLAELRVERDKLPAELPYPEKTMPVHDVRRVPLGYRVKSTDGAYVVQVGERLFTEKNKPGLLTKPEALRRMAHWLERGYTPVLVHVYARKAPL